MSFQSNLYAESVNFFTCTNLDCAVFKVKIASK